MAQRSKNWFLRLRISIEDGANNKVRQATNQDLFDWLLLALWVSLSVLIALSPRHFQIEVKDILAAELLWFTAFVLVRYTKETYYLKKLAQKQNITSIRPY